MQLSRFQDGVGAALLGTGPAHGASWLAELQAQPGFAVYRNTVVKACVDALQASYPTVCQLVGQEWFRAAAAVYARAEPPRDGLLMNYGAGFGAFLRGFEPAAGLPYLPAVAAFDRSWTECHLAADAPAVDRAWLARHPPDALGHLRLQPHPATRWAWCEEHPAYTLWQCHRDGMAVPQSLVWRGDGGLLTRANATVAWQPMSRAGAAFLDACANGLALEAAATRALAAGSTNEAPTHRTADLATLLGSLLDAGALTHAPSPDPFSKAAA